MKLIKKMIVSTMVAASLLVASTTVFAGADDLKVEKALNDTIAKLEETIAKIEQGTDRETINQGIYDAKQAQKEYRFEATERSRQYAAEHIKKALQASRKDDNETVLSELKEALKGYQDMKPIYCQSHACTK